MEVKINASRLSYTPVKYFAAHYDPWKIFCMSLEGELPWGSVPGGIENIKPWEYALYRG